MKKHYNNIQFVFMGLLLVLLVGCNTSKNIAYLQDIQPEIPIEVQEPAKIKIKVNDKLSIRVYSRDKEMMQLFNISQGEVSGPSANSSVGSGTTYTVDESGKIDMPILGLIKVAGMTRLELANSIKYRLVSGNLVRDPIVTVEFASLAYSVLGEVGSPGKHYITTDQLTLLEGLASAGDLTITGRRDNVLVLRTENGKQIPYRVNLTKTSDLYASPVYYLQQDDVIYVEPNVTKANQSDVNANLMRTPGFWLSTVSALISLSLLIKK